MSQTPAPRPGDLVMLRTPAEFAAFSSGARQRANDLMSIRVRANGRADTRFGFATGKNLGDAVVRNRARRRLRVIARGLSPRLVGGQDVLIVLRAPAAAASMASMASSCERLLAGLGGLRPR